MVEHRTLRMEGKEYIITVSDESEALLAADAAGRAVVGVLNPRIPNQSLAPCRFVVERAEDADDAYLTRVLRRRLGLPWVIARTKRLIVREFKKDDPLCTEAVDGGRTFMERELLEAYIDRQYGIFGYGIWALEERETGLIIGKAGFSEEGLGYHIYEPWRRRGYAVEACRAILAYGREELGMEEITVRTEKTNAASIKTALVLGLPVLYF